VAIEEEYQNMSESKENYVDDVKDFVFGSTNGIETDQDVIENFDIEEETEMY